MIHKKLINIRIIFASMVPISIIAFIFGLMTLGQELSNFGVFDGVSGILDLNV
jgi:hypothetical protein